MTTEVTNIMTLSNARFSNDDQQVPDTSGVVDPVGQGRTDSKLATKPRLPDFSTILLEPQNNNGILNTPDLINSLDFNPYQDQLDTSAGSFMDTGAEWEEQSIYDEIPLDVEKLKPAPAMPPVITTSLEPVRPSTLPLAPSQALPLQYGVSPATSSSSCSGESTMTPSADPFDMEQKDLDKVEEELNTICRNLWIPREPHSWTPQHVQKWVKSVLSRYNFPESEQFLVGLDGTNLFMLSKEDLIRRTNAEVGTVLHIDLEWWKAASGSPMEPNSPVYLDLSSSVPTSTQCSTSQHQTPVSSNNPNMYSTAAILSSPTAPLLSSPTAPALTSPMMQQQPEIPTPVMDSIELTSTLYQINSKVEQQHQQQQNYSYLSQMWDEGTVASCDSSLNSVDFSMLKPQIKQEIKEEELDSEDDEEMSMPGEKRRYVSHSKHTIHLWQFLKNLLETPERYGNYIKWLDHAKGIFKIENSREVAKLWGQRKNRPAMNYDKLSRSIRQYYKKGIIKKTTHSKRLVYQFQPTYL